MKGLLEQPENLGQQKDGTASSRVSNQGLAADSSTQVPVLGDTCAHTHLVEQRVAIDRPT